MGLIPEIEIIKENIYRAKIFLLELFFPKACFGCQEEGAWLCQRCQKEILLVKTQVCPDCGRISQSGKYCRLHQKQQGLSGIIVAAYYQEGSIKEAIRNFKYNHIQELEGFLGTILAKALRENLKLGQDFIVTTLPLDFFEISRRGYNQLEILAKNVANKLKLPKNFKIIKKNRRKKSQVKSGGEKVKENLKNSFKIIDKNVIKNRTIILITDVITTGTTLNEGAEVLRAAGARRVWGLVITQI